jgi:hypothetical protein
LTYHPITCKTGKEYGRERENVGFKVISSVIKKSYIFWDMKSYNPVKLNPHFGGACGLHLRVRSISQPGNQHETGSKKRPDRCLLHAGFLVGLLINPEDEGDMFFRNVSLISLFYTALYPRRH